MSSPRPTASPRPLEAFRRYLREHSLPVTAQREAVAATVFEAGERVSVHDIERRLRAQRVEVGTATVYRTVELLVRAELVQQHDFGEGFKRYEPLAGQGHHEHLICLECGRVVECASERLERMKAVIADEHGFRHHHHRLEIYGVCRDCQRRDAVTLGSQATLSRGVSK
ncbi:MAG TPA: Fur family transcriptional regulator [Gemmatimonadales bacterium]|jgi:Fur family ferric uptake transcriptional regulator